MLYCLTFALDLDASVTAEMEWNKMNYHVSLVRRLSVLDQRPKTVRSIMTHIR